MGHLLPPFDLDWVRSSPKSRSTGRNMEDPKAWKPRKAWHLHVREQGQRNPPLGRTESKTMLPGQWVRYHNGLVQALGHKEWNVLGSIWERTERKLQNEQASLGEERWFSPRFTNQGSRLDIQSWWGLSRDSDKYIAQLPPRAGEGMGAGPFPRGGHSLEKTERGTTKDPFPGDGKTSLTQSSLTPELQGPPNPCTRVWRGSQGARRPGS